ncbi:MAG: helix-turn-helix domain-containing protein [Candidatus Bathyarchaeota archaeon]|nr:helix-turn-helix domain-containing protein [Candidatus Bathyarchaeum sp.]
MLLPCEVAVKSVIPAIRSAIARELTQTHGLKQKEVAELLGITQTAVSKYTRFYRGTVIEVQRIEEANFVIQQTVTALAKGQMDKYELAEKLCTICGVIREKGVMCELCSLSDPDIENNKCIVCCPSNKTRMEQLKKSK